MIRLERRIAELERRLENTVRHGVVKEVNLKDKKKPRVRLVIGQGKDGTDMLSPWIAYRQFAGDHKHHAPPTKGMTMTIISPAGDSRQGFAIPLTFSENNPSPSDKPDEHVITYSKAGEDGKASEAKDTDYLEVRKYNERIIQVGKVRVHFRPGDKDEIHMQVGDNTHVRLDAEGVWIKGSKITSDGEHHIASLIADKTAPSTPYGGSGAGFPSFPGWGS